MNAKQFFWCRVFLVTALLLIAGAYINGFRFLKSALDSNYRIATTLTIIAGLCITQGIKESAKNLFDTSNKFWFASFVGFVYVSGILFLFATMFLMLSTTITDPMEKRALHPEQMTFLLPASTILWLLCMASPGLRGFSWRNPFRVPEGILFFRNKRTYANKQVLKKTKNSIHKSIGFIKRKSNILMKGLKK